ncbi:HEPN domain-containing protein [Rickettsiales bacterium]|nr:HEPN domain-containing protein [Rickettsiales bacterium]
MKKSISYLPKNKQEEIQQVTKIILDSCDEIEKIILFGSYARGDYKERKDINKFAKSGHISDYDILVVTESKKTALNHSLWSDIKDNKLKKLQLSADPRIITYDINGLNTRLEEGQYFFSDIKKEGIILFDNGKNKLSEERILTKEEIRELAQNNFIKWFNSSREFYDIYEIVIKKDWNNKAVFNLHQATESSLKCILLVFTNYSPKEHFIYLLQDQISQFYPKIKDFFQKLDKKSEERIKLLEYAYIGARYDTEYYISKEDILILAKEVKELLTITEKICKKEIKTICKI